MSGFRKVRHVVCAKCTFALLFFSSITDGITAVSNQMPATVNTTTAHSQVLIPCNFTQLPEVSNIAWRFGQRHTDVIKKHKDGSTEKGTDFQGRVSLEDSGCGLILRKPSKCDEGIYTVTIITNADQNYMMTSTVHLMVQSVAESGTTFPVSPELARIMVTAPPGKGMPPIVISLIVTSVVLLILVLILSALLLRRKTCRSERIGGGIKKDVKTCEEKAVQKTSVYDEVAGLCPDILPVCQDSSYPSSADSSSSPCYEPLITHSKIIKT